MDSLIPGLDPLQTDPGSAALPGQQFCNVILFLIIQRLTEALNLLTLGWENLHGVLNDIITASYEPP